MKLFAYVSKSRTGHGTSILSKAFFKDPALVHSLQNECISVHTRESSSLIKMSDTISSAARDRRLHNLELLESAAWVEIHDVPKRLIEHSVMNELVVYRGGTWFSAEVSDDFLDHVKHNGEALLSHQPKEVKGMSPKFKGSLIIAVALVLILGMKIHGIL